jgi:hypothetical protein
MDRLVQSLQIQERESLRAEQTEIDDKLTVVLTPWLRRTGWMERYKGMDMQHLSKMTDKPKSGEWMFSTPENC